MEAWEVGLFRRAVWNYILLDGIVGRGGWFEMGLFSGGRGCVSQVPVGVLGLLVRDILGCGSESKGSDGAVAR